MTIGFLDAQLLMALANFGLTSAVAWVCLCRINAMSGDTTRRMTRSTYALILAAATLSGLSPVLLREWPGWSSLGINASLFVLLLSSRRAWLAGLPEFARSSPAPLDELSHGPAPK